MSGDVQLLIAFLMLVTAGLTAYATWRAPTTAAELAERMRQASDRVSDRRKLRLTVFTTLMQERAAYYSVEATRALNSIDIVFHENRDVRERWAELYQCFDPTRNIPGHVQAEKMVALLSAMAADLGLADGLRTDDFSRIYYPNAIADEDKLKQLQREAALSTLTASQKPTANSALQQWPPRPTNNEEKGN